MQKEISRRDGTVIMAVYIQLVDAYQ